MWNEASAIVWAQWRSVDAVGAKLMKEILLDQVRRGATMFLTSHALEVAERLCNRVAVIHDGKLVIARLFLEGEYECG